MLILIKNCVVFIPFIHLYIDLNLLNVIRLKIGLMVEGFKTYHEITRSNFRHTIDYTTHHTMCAVHVHISCSVFFETP